MKKGRWDIHHLHPQFHLHAILPLRLAKGCPKGGVVEKEPVKVVGDNGFVLCFIICEICGLHSGSVAPSRIAPNHGGDATGGCGGVDGGGVEISNR